MCENQNALAEKVSETEAKLENQFENVLTKKRDNQTASVTKLENGMRDNQNVLSLMKNMATLALFHSHLPIYYQWNASDCDWKIVINESKNAIQRNATGTEGFPGFCSCRAGPIQMPSAAAVGRIGIIYAEYRILASKGAIFIGLSTKEMPLYTRLGNARVSYGYANFGRIDYKNANGNELNISDNVPSFGIGDVVGCGLNRTTRQVFFTKNGQRLNITNLYVDEGTADLYPTVTLLFHGDAVEANFGPNFQYNLSKKS
ncbi:hypothetical protein niasHS_002042 [Heterodera schachtii]|uniref:B30.2/SPRY domain-containing protein n=1 Tax=Heterodera schachtii TaxID=97005 RepID=A0ABD2K5N8_HETSC